MAPVAAHVGRRPLRERRHVADVAGHARRVAVEPRAVVRQVRMAVRALDQLRRSRAAACPRRGPRCGERSSCGSRCTRGRPRPGRTAPCARRGAVVAFRCASEMSPRLKLSPPPALVWQFRQASLPGMRRSTAACRSDTVILAVSGTNLKTPLTQSSLPLVARASGRSGSRCSRAAACEAVGRRLRAKPRVAARAAAVHAPCLSCRWSACRAS